MTVDREFGLWMWFLIIAEGITLILLHKWTRSRVCFILLLNQFVCINSFPASGDFFRLLITFANSLDPDQPRQNVGPVGPDLDPNCLTLWWYSWKIFLKKKRKIKNNSQMTKSMQSYPGCKGLNQEYEKHCHITLDKWGVGGCGGVGGGVYSFIISPQKYLSRVLSESTLATQYRPL